MQNKWYCSLVSKIEIGSTGPVADLLKETVINGLFRKLPVIREIDQNLATDITIWFNEIFNSWFKVLSEGLEVENTPQALTDSEYLEKINLLIQTLWVARSYYVKRADGAFVSSIKTTEQVKGSICEELAGSIEFAFESALKQFGDKIQGRSVEMTIASIWKGSTPERFTWNGNVIVNHSKYEKVIIMNSSETGNQNIQCSNSKQYLPWVFCAAFGLIAWSAAAKENNKEPKQQRSNK